MWLPSDLSHICIVGGGNATHVLSALLCASSAELHVSILAPFQDEAERLSASPGITLDQPDGSTLTGKPHLITASPAAALEKARLVILPLPLFAVPAVCDLIAPHLAHGAWVAFFPAQGGVQWLAADLLGLRKNRPDLKLFGLDKLPYNCRILEFGKRVRVFGYKERLKLACYPNDPVLAKRMCSTVSAIIPRLQLSPAPNFLLATLAPGNQCIHPARMYSLFKDNTTRKTVPMFYDMKSYDDVKYIQLVSDEVQAISRAIEKVAKGMGLTLDLSGVLDVGDAVLAAYDDVKDTSSLMTIFSTCKGFEGIGTPMKKVIKDGEPIYQVDWHSRYFTEDIASLCVLHGLAEIVDVQVPTIDLLIRWAQVHMDDGEYQFVTEDGSLNTDRKKLMYSPQYWGITDKEQLVRFHAEVQSDSTADPNGTATTDTTS
ncbi:unnamed protein product [Chondrus crispus]|uniref:Opine dehydrogenase domain-containing protein n=1 Tax=Chondrus crispus TaxID=2769 RepID=R7QNK5_CHOCR|nr:unnamed protein product [Chondrus crispus]CDF39689.1 unnamed protein product [Chondrus crispus]|eukprot:XP_005709983.1 unnamed protein product [Chondrus crispus]